MALATWWATDPMPELSVLSGFHAAPATDDAALAELNRLSTAEVRARRADGHRAYLGFLDGEPMAYGWVATREAPIGELGLTIRLPKGHRYLWDFATLPGFRGRGVYPHLLQAMLRQEALDAERFWIIHAPENLPSGAGMEHAGLLPVGQLSFQPDGSVGLAPLGSLERAQAGADLLGLPLLQAELAPCWRCGGSTADRSESVQVGPCWPPVTSQVMPCTCAIERTRPAPVAGASVTGA